MISDNNFYSRKIALRAILSIFTREKWYRESFLRKNLEDI